MTLVTDVRGTPHDLMSKYTSSYFLVKFDKHEDVDMDREAQVVAVSDDEEELMEMQGKHEDRGCMLFLAGADKYKNFLGGAQICRCNRG